jgi:hypothetical protein
MDKEKQSNSTIGPIIGSVIVIAVLVVAALYIWGQHLNIEEKRKIDLQNAVATNGQVIVIPIHSTSTNPSDIQKDLNSSTTINSLGY